MIDWFSIVWVSNMQTIRWVLGALNGADGPVSLRQAQAWCTRTKSVGVVDVKQVGALGGSVDWTAWKVTGQSKPDLLRQTTRRHGAQRPAFRPPARAAGGRTLTRGSRGSAQQQVEDPQLEDGTIRDFRAKTAAGLDEEARVLSVMISGARHGVAITSSQQVEAQTVRPQFKEPLRFLQRLSGSTVVAQSANA